MTTALPTTSKKRVLDPGSIWKHNKRGTKYEIIGIAGSQVDENESDMVVYQGLDDGGKLWVRPVNRFLEKTNPTTYRFDRIGDPDKTSSSDFCGCLASLFGCSSGTKGLRVVVVHDKVPTVAQETAEPQAMKEVFATIDEDEELTA